MCLAGLSDSSSKVQVSAVNILNLVLSQPQSAAALGPLLQSEEGTVLAALSGLLDHSLSLLRAKALVTVMLLCR
jgi:serine/threonine-protein kinase ULK4